MKVGDIQLGRTIQVGPAPRRRGIALLLALAALLTMTLVVTSVVRVASTVNVVDGRRRTGREAAALSERISVLIPRLLGQIPSEPTAGPWFTVIESPNDGVLVRVRGIDLSGRLHTRHLGTPARFGLPAELEGFSWDHRDRVGPVMLEELLTDNDWLAIYPEPLAPLDLGADGEDEPPLEPGDDEDESDGGDEDDEFVDPYLDRPFALCEWVTTVGSGVLNVNTSPYLLLEAAVRAADASAAEECLAAREKGLPVPDAVIARLNEPPGGPDDDEELEDDVIRFVNQSEACGLLVEIQHGQVTRRWWMTMVKERGRWRLYEHRRIYR
ncbi:MAG: hypothetical protein KAS72_11475 [Phycisphaerales bacterium]|nr:hypothetical protein [Phycisphaerales bacterium]